MRPARPGPRSGQSGVRWAVRVTALPAKAFGAAAGAGALSALCGVGLLATSGWLITRASQRPPVLSLCVAIGAVQAFSLGKGLFRYLQRLGVHHLSLRVLGTVRLHLWDSVVPLAPAGLGGLGHDQGGSEGRAGAGSVLSGFLSDADAVAEGFAKVINSAVEVSASVVCGTVLATVVYPSLGAVLLGGAGATAVAVAVLARAGRAVERKAVHQKAVLADVVVQTVRSAPELVAYGRSDLVEQRLEQARRRSTALDRRRAWVAGVSRAVSLGGAGAVLVAVVAMGLAASGDGRVGGVMLAVAAFATLAVMDQCATLPGAWAAASSARAAAMHLTALDERPPPAVEPRCDHSGEASGATASLCGAEVTAPDGTGILKGVSVSLAEGERVALVGPSGSGKSAALHVLLHFLECSAGEARLGGVRVGDMTRKGIASCAAWAPDEPHIFATSVRDNLRMAQPSAGDRECLQALEQVGLSEWAGGLPDGLSTEIGSGGRPLSAGEAQRLGLARALLAEAPVLLLDEPTSRLGAVTSARVLPGLLGTPGRSTLVVTHDPDVAGRVDRAVVLEDGRTLA